MSDFGELCPLFNTGVFSEMVFPSVRLSDVSSCANALFATADAMASGSGNFTFGRTVVVTGAWLRKTVAGDGAIIVYLNHHSSRNATGTVFGSLTVSVSVTGMSVLHGYVPMTVTDMTFTAAAVLGLCPATVTVSGTTFDLIIRYKEK